MLCLVFFRVTLDSQVHNISKCGKFDPCEHRDAVQYVKENINVTFENFKFETFEDLQELRNFIHNTVYNNVSYDLNYSIIDGKRFNIEDRAFLYINNYTNISFGNAIITKFRMPILIFRNGRDSTFFNLTIENCSIDHKIGLIQIAISKAIFENVTISNCLSSKCPIILVASSNFLVENLTFSDNQVLHEYNIPLIYVLNSIAEFSLSSIQNNDSPSSPLISAEYFAMIGIWDCIFKSNEATHLFYIDSSYSYLNFTNSSFIDNTAIIAQIPKNSNFTIKNSSIIESFSPDSPLFIVETSFVVLQDSRFYKNNAISFLKSISNSSIQITEILVKKNIFTENFINLPYNTTISMNNSVIKSIITKSIIFSQDGEILIDNINISKLNGKMITCNSTILNISNSNFAFDQKDLITGDSFNTTLSNLTFTNKTIINVEKHFYSYTIFIISNIIFCLLFVFYIYRFSRKPK